MINISEFVGRQKAKSYLIQAFKLSGLYKEHGKGEHKQKIYPKINAIQLEENRKVFKFNLINGINPDLINKNEYVFKQIFGEHIEINNHNSNKYFTLNVYKNGLPSMYKYNYDSWDLSGYDIPIVVGVDRAGELIIFDLKKFHHVQITGITNSGKSVFLNSILVTLIKYFNSNNLQLFLADMKRTELSIYKNVEHCKYFASNANELENMLSMLDKIVAERFEMMEREAVRHVDELKDCLPIVVVMVDEFALAGENDNVMSSIKRLTSISRACNVYFFIALQRADSTCITGTIKNNLGVKISFKQSDNINAKIAGVKGVEDIRLSDKGRAIIDIGESKLIQAPFISTSAVKESIRPYTIQNKNKYDTEQIEQSENQIQNGEVFGVLYHD